LEIIAVTGDQVPFMVFISKTEHYSLVLLFGFRQLLQVETPEGAAKTMLATDKQSWMQGIGSSYLGVAARQGVPGRPKIHGNSTLKSFPSGTVHYAFSDSCIFGASARTIN
jgi:hypothetical protein